MTKTKRQKERKKAAARPHKKEKHQQPKKKKKYAAMGEQIGSTLGGPIGGFLGKGAGAIIDLVSGRGAYRVNKNSLMTDNGPPLFSGDGSIVVEHREFLGDVTGSTTFSVTEYDINPGLVRSYPWLSEIANAFQEYELLGQLYEFKSTSADALNSTNTALGTVITATQYDVYAAPFTTKQEMEQYEYSVSCSPSQNSLHPVECAKHRNLLDNLLIRNGNPAGDVHFYDAGTFSIATVGMQAAAVIGELWVTYKIRLMKPMIGPSGSGLLAAAHLQTTLSNATQAAPFADFGLSVSSSFTLTPTSNTITGFPIGRYIAIYTTQLANSGTGMNILGLTSGGNNINLFSSGGLLNNQPEFNSFQINVGGMSVCAFDVTATNAVFGVRTAGSYAAKATNNTSGIWFVRIPTGVSMVQRNTKVGYPIAMSARIKELEDMVRLLGNQQRVIDQRFLLRADRPAETPFSSEEDEDDELARSVHLSRDEVVRLLKSK